MKPIIATIRTNKTVIEFMTFLRLLPSTYPPNILLETVLNLNSKGIKIQPTRIMPVMTNNIIENNPRSIDFSFNITNTII